jgi:hypothetical protein
MQQAQQTTMFSQGLGNLIGQMKSLALSSNRTLEIIGTSGAQVRQGNCEDINPSARYSAVDYKCV